jgi:CubicO group peptidase (beta-lactamase class C family)
MKSIWVIAMTLTLAGCDRLLLGSEEEPVSMEKNLQVPDQLDDGLEVSALSDENIDAQRIHSMIRSVHANPSHRHRSILIARNNKLVLEAYFNGWNRDRKQDIRSATKSFTSSLVGIAIDKGFIADVHQPVLGFFNEYASIQNPDQRKSQATIKDFLRMRTGLSCNDWNVSSPGNEERMYQTDDWVKFILDLPVSGSPGQNFSYCTGAPVTLGAVITNVSGKSIPDFAKEYLFDPLGIREYSWEFTPVGQTDTGGHIHMKPRDMLKFGLLFLNNGNWKGRQLISREWIEESTTPDGAVPGSRELAYGYLWWATTWTVDQREIAAYFATGNGGQLIFVIPSLRAVVIFTGGSYNSDFLPRLLGMMAGQLLPSFK